MREENEEQHDDAEGEVAVPQEEVINEAEHDDGEGEAAVPHQEVIDEAENREVNPPRPEYEGPLQPSRIQLSDQERQWALNVKEAIQADPELDGVLERLRTTFATWMSCLMPCTRLSLINTWTSSASSVPSISWTHAHS